MVQLRAVWALRIGPCRLPKANQAIIERKQHLLFFETHTHTHTKTHTHTHTNFTICEWKALLWIRDQRFIT